MRVILRRTDVFDWCFDDLLLQFLGHRYLTCVLPIIQVFVVSNRVLGSDFIEHATYFNGNRSFHQPKALFATTYIASLSSKVRSGISCLVVGILDRATTFRRTECRRNDDDKPLEHAFTPLSIPRLNWEQVCSWPWRNKKELWRLAYKPFTLPS